MARSSSQQSIAVDWNADSSQRWTVPLRGGVGKIFHVGKLPVTLVERLTQPR